eukprot:558419-Alexandrium_andersonii.AAC.1
MSAMAPTDRRRGKEPRRPALHADTTPQHRDTHATAPRRAPRTNAPPPAVTAAHGPRDEGERNDRGGP